MRNQILSILAGYPGVKAEQVGHLWQVSVGPYGGARENGVSLARDLRDQYDFQNPEHRELTKRAEPVINYHMARDGAPLPDLEPATHERIVTVSDPAQEALIEHLRAELEAAREKVKAVESAPPADLADLIDWTAPPKDRQAALLVKLNEVNGLIGLAEDRGGRAAPELYRKRDRLDSGIRFNRPTLTETLG